MPELVTRVTVEEVPSTSGNPITVLRFSGDITSGSQPAILGRSAGFGEADPSRFFEGGLFELERDRAGDPDDDCGEQAGADDPFLRAQPALHQGFYDGRDYEVHNDVSG
jgi:hypothetical protein